jgi:hypothetical protein
MMGLDLPFNMEDPRELEMRALVGNQRWMQHKHYAFAGSADLPHVGPVSRAVPEMESGPSQLEVIMVPGDMFSSFHHGIEGYLALILDEWN